MKYVILDPANEQARLLDAETFAGKEIDPAHAVIEVADDFDWCMNRVDWETGELVADASGYDADLHRYIDAHAGAFRARFITDIAGQEMTYQRKEAEARTWVAADEPDPAAFPFLAAEAAETGEDIADLAAAVIANADAWALLGARIEGRRIGAKRNVTEATTRADKDAAAAVDWEGLLQ